MKVAHFPHMRFDPDALPELKKSSDPRQRKNETFDVMTALITRSPMPEADWRARYEVTFLERAWKEDLFRALVATGKTPSTLNALQDMLDAA
jgi:hypothetical protein